MPRVRDLIGQKISLRSPILSEESLTSAKLVDVDEAGIWIEYPPFMESILKAAKASQSPKTVVIFLPYAQVHCIVASEDYPYLSEKLIE